LLRENLKASPPESLREAAPSRCGTAPTTRYATCSFQNYKWLPTACDGVSLDAQTAVVYEAVAPELELRL